MLSDVIVPLLTRWAVPAFFMISGCLLLDPDRDVGLDKIKRYILRMVKVICSIAMVYCLIRALFDARAGGMMAVLKQALRDWLEGKSWDHMWYVYALLGLYVFTPVLRAFVRAADRDTALFVLGALYIFTALRPTLDSATGIAFVQILPAASVNLLYYLLGYYLPRWKRRPGATAAVLAVGVIGFAAVRLMELGGLAVVDGTAFIALYSAALFVFCSDGRLLKKLAGYRWIQALSAASFGIYLLHPIFIHGLYRILHIYPDILPMVLGEAALVSVVVLCSFVATLVLKVIPPMRKIL